MLSTNLAVIFALMSGGTYAQEPPAPVESETLCASFKMYAFDRPDVEFLNRKRKKGKIPAEDPDPSWVMTEIRGTEFERSAKRTCGSADASEVVECCFRRGKPVQLTVTEGRTKCVGLLGPMDPEMPIELFDRMASKMMACDSRRSLNPPISVFGQTIKKEWRNLTLKWMNTRKYMIESWGPEAETHDKRQCFDVVGLPEGRRKRSGYKHADAMSWKMMRPDGSMLCGSNRYRRNGRTHRGRVTQCCNIVGRETILRLEDQSSGLVGWGSGFIRFMDLRVHNKAASEKGHESDLRKLVSEIDMEENIKDIVFNWGDRKSFKVGRLQANSDCGPGLIAHRSGDCRPCTEKDREAVNKDGTIKYPQCQTVQ